MANKVFRRSSLLKKYYREGLTPKSRSMPRGGLVYKSQLFVIIVSLLVSD